MHDNNRYVRAQDGTPLAWGMEGHEGPAWVFTHGLATSNFYWRRLFHRFRGKAQLITWDLKGHGHSGAARELERLTVATCADDLRRVMDAAKVDRAVLFGFSLGCQVVLEAWRLMPERIAALVPMFGSYGQPFKTLFIPGLGWMAFHLFRRFGPVAAGPGLRLLSVLGSAPGGPMVLRHLGIFGSTVADRDIQAFCAHLARVDVTSWHRLGIASLDHDVHADDLLETVTVPVLIFSAERDNFTPPELSRRVHQRLPNSHLVRL
ncbi:MAG: alpha/beta hydrolase, partial [Myxococcota bacterium]